MINDKQLFAHARYYLSDKNNYGLIVMSTKSYNKW